MTCSRAVSESSEMTYTLWLRFIARCPPSARPTSSLTYEVRQMYFTLPSVLGEALDPTSGTCAASTWSRIAVMTSELATPVIACTACSLTSWSTAARPVSAVLPSSTLTNSTG